MEFCSGDTPIFYVVQFTITAWTMDTPTGLMCPIGARALVHLIFLIVLNFNS